MTHERHGNKKVLKGWVEREEGHIEGRQWRDKEHIERRQGKEEDILRETRKIGERGRRRGVH